MEFLWQKKLGGESNQEKKMAKKKFLRTKWRNYSKLGRGRKKKQKYRRPRGRHNKMREGMKSNPVRVKIGYKKSRKGKEMELKISNIKDLDTIKKGKDSKMKIIIIKIGKRKKIEIVKKAKQLGINFENLNIDKFLKKIEKEFEMKKKKKEEEKKSKEKKKKKVEKSSLKKTLEKTAEAEEETEKKETGENKDFKSNNEEKEKWN